MYKLILPFEHVLSIYQGLPITDIRIWHLDAPARAACLYADLVLIRDGLFAVPIKNTTNEYPPDIYGIDGLYIQYLVSWQEKFGQKDTARINRIHMGQIIPYTIERLTLDEYNYHVQCLLDEDKIFRRAWKNRDVQAVADSNFRAREHELALLY